MTTPLIEAIARAMEAESDFLRDSVATETLERCIAAALTAITEAGYAVVPIEPTRDMDDAGFCTLDGQADCSCSASRVYRAMISAAQGDEA